MAIRSRRCAVGVHRGSTEPRRTHEALERSAAITPPRTNDFGVADGPTRVAIAPQVAIPAYVAYDANLIMEQAPQFVCTACKTITTFTRPNNSWMLWMGSVMVVLGLFGPPLVFLWPPGLVLVIMAYRQRKPTCPACRSRRLIPVNTPLGRELTGGPPP